MSNVCFYQNVIPVLGSDVIYSEEAVLDLLSALQQLSGRETTIFLAGELRNGNNCSLFLIIFLFFFLYCFQFFSWCRCCPWILLGVCNEGFCNWAFGPETVASRILQQPCCVIRSREEVKRFGWDTDLRGKTMNIGCTINGYPFFMKMTGKEILFQSHTQMSLINCRNMLKFFIFIFIF